MATTYTLIQATNLTGSQSSVTFSSIPSTYTDLVLRCSVRTDSGLGIAVEFNATASSYSYTRLRGDGSAASSSRASSQTYLLFSPNDNAGDTANTFGNAELYIPNYAGSTNKPTGSFGVQESNTTNVDMYTYAGLWSNTAAINQIKITQAGGNNFVSGSSFYLYGIKNS